jgi:hypothetical protein
MLIRTRGLPPTDVVDLAHNLRAALSDGDGVAS